MDIMRMGDEPKYLGSWDLYELPGQKIKATIREIRVELVEDTKGQKKNKAVMYFVEDFKPMILNIENKKRLAKLFATKENTELAGKVIEICHEKVKAFGDIHDALRIVPRKLPQVNGTANVKLPKCEICGKPIQAAQGMTGEQVAAYTKDKYGQAICSGCARKKAQEKAQEAANETVDE